MLEELRCKNCGKKLGEKLSGKVEIVCSRCSHFNVFIAQDLTKHNEQSYSLVNTKVL